jgi:CheY-like chemotaxis protein
VRVELQDFDFVVSVMNSDVVIWTRKALVRLFDLDFLNEHIAHAGMKSRFGDAQRAQQSLLDAIEALRPPANVSVRAAAWRQYNVLNLIYVQGLSQAEVSAQLNLGVRQLRRELAKAVRAVAAILFAGAADEAEVAVSTNPEMSPAAEYLQAEEVLRAALSLLDPLLQKQDVTINVALARPLPTFQGDPMVARQLIIAALTWMLHGMRSTTQNIEVDTDRRGLNLWFHRPSINDNDAQLGLVHQLAQLAGAEVELRTGDEAVLGIRLPAASKRCVLLIDDNADAIRLVGRMLQDSSEFHLVAARSPDEAMRLIASLRPACVILDVMMPQRDGWEVLTLMKAHPETTGIPVIISSVLKQTELALALGASAVLPKPFTTAELLATLTRVTAPSRRPDASTGITPAIRSALLL